MVMAGASVSACAAIWGFQDSLDGGARDGATDGTTSDREASGDSGTDAIHEKDVRALDVTVTTPTACTATTPESSAYYVSSAHGTDSATCGEMTSPCQTISQGIKRAALNQVSVVNVAEGTYPEALTLQPGITLVGGWINATAGVWTKDTSDAGQTELVVQPVSGTTTVTATFSGDAGPSGLCTMTLQSKATAGAGETLYGIFAMGASTTLSLSDVIVQVASGGNGAPGSNGAPGTSGSTAGCPVGSGLMGTPPGQNGAAAKGGAFSGSGYVTGNGEDGGAGKPGGNGVMLGGGDCVSDCVTCTILALVCTSSDAKQCGAPATPGCAGSAGGPGTGGGGGGSSVGIFASQGAIVTIDNSRLIVGNGGNGGPGGLGGDGGAGAVGVPITGSCNTTCNGSCDSTTPVQIDGGPPSTGGSGSSGGMGGGGAGGFSCPIAVNVVDAGAVVKTKSTQMTSGSGGMGGGSAPNGGSGADGGVCSF
jgi:hypothetical protein